jgi:hypothetical protein
MRVLKRKTKAHQETSWTISPIPFTLIAANQQTTTLKGTGSEGKFLKLKFRIAASQSRAQRERLSCIISLPLACLKYALFICIPCFFEVVVIVQSVMANTVRSMMMFITHIR